MARAKKTRIRVWLIAIAAVVLLGVLILAGSKMPDEREAANPPANEENEQLPAGPEDIEEENGTDSKDGNPEDPTEEDPTEEEETEEEETETPVIYTGQELIIPGGGSEKPAPSRVVKEGILKGEQKQIALSFDAGWLYDRTEDLLDVLRTYELKCTFFTRALWVESHPELAKKIAADGHVVENHSLTHGHIVNMSEDEIREELRQSTEIIQSATGRKPVLFRPPYGEYDNRLLQILSEEGYHYTILWTVDSHDWAEELNGRQITTEYLVDRVLSNAGDNGIVLMHIGGYKTVEALPQIIEGLQKEGYKFVTVNEMLPPASPGQDRKHIVQSGETLYSLAKLYNVTVGEIIEANCL